MGKGTNGALRWCHRDSLTPVRMSEVHVVCYTCPHMLQMEVHSHSYRWRPPGGGAACAPVRQLSAADLHPAAAAKWKVFGESASTAGHQIRPYRKVGTPSTKAVQQTSHL